MHGINLASVLHACRYTRLLSGSRDEAPSLVVLPAFITYDAATPTAGISAERIADRMVISTKVCGLYRYM